MSPWGQKKATLIFGCFKDKDAKALIHILRPWVQNVFLPTLPSSRGRNPQELRALWGSKTPAVCMTNFAAAWREARRDLGFPVLVTGSLSLAGEGLKIFSGSLTD
jgi:folylpolyglutamate synthase/dihydropteroate synthase